MRKWILAVLLVFLWIGLAGCQVPTEDTPTPLGDSFLFEAYRLDQTLIVSKQIPFNEEDDQTLLEAIIEEIEMDITYSQWGAFINGIEGHYPKEYGVTYNYNFMLYVNHEMASTGIGDILYQEGLIITFKEEFSSWLDQTDYWVDQVIYQFIEDQLSEFLNTESMDYHVFSALRLMQLKGYPVPDVIQTIPMPEADLSHLGGLFRSTLYQTGYGMNDPHLESLLGQWAIDHPWSAVNVLTALSLLNPEHERINALIDHVAQVIDFMDPDYVGMALLALSKHQEHPKTQAVLADWLAFVQHAQTKNGIESWGTTNSASTATVILGLVSFGINPRSEAYTVEGVDLIEALRAYHVEGGFKWQISDQEANLAFATPQVFAALVAYKLSRDIWGNPPIYLFDLR